MADDITLTVRVRDLTRGDLSQVRQRLRGMDEDMRRTSGASGEMSQRARVLSRDINGVSGRLGQLSRTGNMASHEMTYMNRSMSLLSRELTNARRAGHLTTDEFRNLQNQLSTTRLDFDRLNRDMDRHSAVARRAARAESELARAAQNMGRLQAAAQREDQNRTAALVRQAAARQRALQNMGRVQAAALREEANRVAAQQRQIDAMGRAHTAALREEARRQATAQREADRLAEAARREEIRRGTLEGNQFRRILRAHTAAIREEGQRQAAATRAAANARTQALRDEEREVNRFRQSTGDIDLSHRFRAANIGDNHDLVRGFDNIRTQLNGISTNSTDAARHLRMFTRDMNNMSTILSRARNSGGISRRDFDSLSSGIDLARRNLSTLRSQGVITRATFRRLSDDLTQMGGHLRTLDHTGNVFTRLSTRVALWGGHLRTATRDGGLVVRMLGRLGDWGARGASRGSLALGVFFNILGRVAGRMAKFSQAAWIMIAVIALIAPAAAALGAILTTALGGAFIALGAYALKGTAGVKTAFGDLKSTLGSVIKSAAAPLEDFLVAGLGQVGQAARKLQPALTQAFTAAGPLVSNFFKAFTNFGSSAMPGIVSALNNSKSAMAGFAEGMSRIGKGFGDMFRIITQGNDKEIGRIWVTLGNEIGNTLKVIGEFIADMTKSGTASLLLVGIFRTLNGILHVIAAAFHIVDVASGGLFKNLANHISGFKGLDTTLGTSFESSGKSLMELRDNLSDVDKKIAKIKQFGKNMPGPSKRLYEDNSGLDKLTATRAGLLDAIKQKEQENADAVANEAQSYQDLVTSIQALADLNRSYLDAQAAQAQAVADANKDQGKYKNALKMVGGQLKFNTQAGIDAYGMLSKIAQTTKESTEKAEASHAPWEQVRKNWQNGYNDLVRLADGMGLTKKQAQDLATQILGIPPTKEVEFKARTQDAINGLDSVVAAIQASPDQKTVTVDALTGDAIGMLKDLGFKVTQLPNGKFSITAETGDAKQNVETLQAARDALKGKNITLSASDHGSGVAKTILGWLSKLHDKDVTITTTHKTILETVISDPNSTADALRKQAQNLAKGHATGGYIDGPGTKTSDSVVARLSRGEFVMPASAVDHYGTRFMEAMRQRRLRLPGFARGGKVSKAAKAEQQARNEVAGSFGISHFGRMAGYKNTPFEKGLGSPGALGDLVSALNGWRSAILKATHGGVEKSLLKSLDRAGKSLIGYEKKLAKVNSSLDKAKTNLDNLKQAAASLRDSVTSGVMSSTDITRIASNDSNVTMTDVMGGMRQSLDQSTSFADALKQLKARGVSSTVISQIAQAGISGGGLQTASALLGASDSEISQINSMQKQINAAAKSAGNTAANAMYGAGIKAAQGLVDGLTKKQKDIEKAMMHIAKSMEKAIKHALGIHSPSRVMMKVGDHTAEGFALGIKNNRSVDTAWTSMLNTGPSGSSVGSGMSAGGGQYVFPVYIGNKMIDEIILDSNRRTVRTRGGDVQAVYGRKTK